MPPLIIAALVSAAASGASAISSGVKARRKRKAGEAMMSQAQKDSEALGPSPTMEVPESVDDYIDLQRKMSRQEMPGSSLMRQDIAQTQAGTLSSAKQMGQGADAMAAMLSSGQNKMRALSQMGIAAAQYSSGRQDQYAQAVQSRAPWEQQQFEYNKWIPWQQQKNEIMGERNVGMSLNYQGQDEGSAAFTQGMSGVSQAAWGAANNEQVQNWWGGLGGGGGMGNAIGPQTPANTGQASYSPDSGTYDKLPFGQ